MSLRFIDLFAGIGGFHTALKRQGLHCVFSSEIDLHAARAYALNFGNLFNPLPAGDITQIAAEDIPAHDVLCAGFPCQSFSITGNRKGLSDARGLLFDEIVRIAKYHKPRLILLENVKHILKINDGLVCQKIYKDLDEAGYKVSHAILNLCHYNLPQNRLRVYFVAIRNDADLIFTPPAPIAERAYVKDVLLPDCETDHLIVKSPFIAITKPEEQPLANKPVNVGYVNQGNQGERIYSPNGVGITLTANSGGAGHKTGLYLVNGKVRRLHQDEAKALMGFAKSHIVSPGKQGYKQLGNAVSPKMIELIYKNIKK